MWLILLQATIFTTVEGNAFEPENPPNIPKGPAGSWYKAFTMFSSAAELMWQMCLSSGKLGNRCLGTKYQEYSPVIVPNQGINTKLNMQIPKSARNRKKKIIRNEYCYRNILEQGCSLPFENWIQILISSKPIIIANGSSFHKCNGQLNLVITWKLIQRGNLNVVQKYGLH